MVLHKPLPSFITSCLIGVMAKIALRVTTNEHFCTATHAEQARPTSLISADQCLSAIPFTPPRTTHNDILNYLEPLG